MYSDLPPGDIIFCKQIFVSFCRVDETEATRQNIQSPKDREDETWARGIKPSDVLVVCAWHWNRKMHHEPRPQLFLPVKQLVYKACDTACLQVNITWVIKPVAHCATKSIAHRGKVGCTRWDRSLSYTSRWSQPHITHDIVGRWHKTEVFPNFIQTSGKGLNCIRTSQVTLGEGSNDDDRQTLLTTGRLSWSVS